MAMSYFVGQLFPSSRLLIKFRRHLLLQVDTKGCRSKVILICIGFGDYLPVTVAMWSEVWVLASWFLGSWVRIPLKTWMFVRVFLCCVVLCR
jgi:hypothetical protein